MIVHGKLTLGELLKDDTLSWLVSSQLRLKEDALIRRIKKAISGFYTEDTAIEDVDDEALRYIPDELWDVTARQALEDDDLFALVVQWSGEYDFIVRDTLETNKRAKVSKLFKFKWPSKSVAKTPGKKAAKKKPVKKKAAKKAAKSRMDERLDFIVFTALPLESQAMLEFLGATVEHALHSGTVVEIGAVGTRRVGLVECGPGNTSAGIICTDAITSLRPRAVLFVGIAGGVKDVKLGDVVAATKVYGYESGKESEDGFRPRPDLGQSNHRLIQRARANLRRNAWLERLSQKPSTPQVHVAPIAAGEKVVANVRSDTFKFIRHNYGDAVAVEMEGRGFLSAAFHLTTEALVIRGISDLIDKKEEADSQQWQPRAALHAAAFAIEVMATVQLPDDDHHPSRTSRSPTGTHGGDRRAPRPGRPPGKPRTRPDLQSLSAEGRPLPAPVLTPPHIYAEDIDSGGSIDANNKEGGDVELRRARSKKDVKLTTGGRGRIPDPKA